MSRSMFKILKMPCLDLKQAAFDKKLDFFGVKYNQSVNFIHKDLVFLTLKFKSEVKKYILK